MFEIKNWKLKIKSMTLTWLGQSCFKIQAKTINGDNTIVTDPYDPQFIGLRLPRLNADIITTSHEHNDHSNIKAVAGTSHTPEPFLVNSPGEYELNDIFIYGIHSWHDSQQGQQRGDNIIYVVKAENINICHLGDLGQLELADEQLELMNNIDILLIPVGGKYTIDGEQAINIISQIEPRIIIPMHYKIPGLKIDIAPTDKFLKQMGGHVEELDKLKISKKDLPQEGTRLVVLKP